jgi:hypothetical protein
MSGKTKNVIERAVKTFIETAVSYLIAHLSGANFFENNDSKTVWVGLALSAGAAGLSAVWNGVLQPLLKTPSGGSTPTD